jgi:hypothetical protein
MPGHKTVYRMPTEAVTMALRKQRRSRAQQQNLFQAPTAPPQWRLLPEVVRRQAVELLSRMVREHGQRQHAGSEVPDE